MRKFQCFQNTRFLQLTVLFKLVKDEIPDEGRNAQMMRCRIRLNHRNRRDRCPSHDIFSRAVVPTRWSPPTWAVSFLSYHSFYIAYTGKKLKKAENNEQTFFWTNKYLKRTIVRYGLSPLARTLISFMSSWIFFTLLSGHRTIYTLRQFCFLCAAPPLLTSYLRKRWLNRRVRFYKNFYTWLRHSLP